MSIIKMTAEEMELNERLHDEYMAGIVAQDNVLQEQERARIAQIDPNVEALDTYAEKALRGPVVQARTPSDTYQSPTYSYSRSYTSSAGNMGIGLALGVALGNIF